MRTCLQLIVLLLLINNLHAQSRRFTFRTISINEGLSQSSVVDIAIDQAGFIWLATQDGLNRFDGSEFISFQKNFDDITTPNGSKLGKIFFFGGNDGWLITRGGKLEKLNLYTQTFYAASAPGNRGQLPLDIKTVHHSDKETWIGTANVGLYIYRNGNPPVILNDTTANQSIAGKQVEQIYVDNKKNYWILTENGVSLLNQELKGTKNFPFRDLKNGIPCSAIDQDSMGTLWLGSFGNGLWFKDPAENFFKKFTGFNNENNLPADLVIETVLADSRGRIWIGTFGKGLYIIDPSTQTLYHEMYRKEDPYSIGFNDVLALREDKQGGIWIGTDGGGISYFDDRLANFATYSRNNIAASVPIEQVRAITTDLQQRAWIGTSNGGLTVMDQQPHVLPGLKKIGSLFSDSGGDIWVGTQEDGLKILGSHSFQVKKNYLGNETIWCMVESSDKKVWVGTRNSGLYLFDKTSGEQIHLQYPTLASNNIRTLTRVPGNKIYIGYEDKGIDLLDEATNQIDPRIAKPLEKLVDQNVVIRSTYFLYPYLWIGTFGNGLIGFDTRTEKIAIVTEQQGLPNNTIYGILSDTANALWLSTNKGLCYFRVPANLDQIDRANFSVYTSEDGIQANEFNTGAHYRSPEGKLFFGGINGFTVFDPSKLANKNITVPVVITRILSNNQPLAVDTLITYKKLLKLPYSKNSLSFNFAAIDLISADRMNYFYQLVGHDEDWIDAGTRNYAAYTNLPSGKYTFKIKALRNLSDAPGDITELVIYIEPPFWRRAWFILLCIVFVSAILLSIYRYRISQLIKLQKVRSRIATDLHDDIGSSLTNINILTELTRQNMQQQNEAVNFLDRISEEVNTFGQALDDIVWSINSNNDSLEQTVARMRRYAAEMLDSSLESYTIQFDEKFGARKLNMEQRRDFYLLFKEIINNIHKHSKAKHVDIRIWFDKSTLHMQVKDDGIGFDPAAPSTRNGIRNLYARAEKWDGEVKIDSRVGIGTNIQVAIPVIT